MKVREVLGQELITLILTKNGTLVLLSEFDLVLSCSMSFVDYPFDEHLCPIELVVTDVNIFIENERMLIENSNDTTEQDYIFKVILNSIQSKHLKACMGPCVGRFCLT